jgi:phytoene desaturase
MSKPQAVVIGSGFGGLSAAIRLQAAGIQVTVFEKRDQPGGRAYVYRDQGFTFDAGPTVITAPECLSELFDLAGKSMEQYVQLLPVFPFYRLYWEDGYQFDYSNHDQLTRDQIHTKNPRDVEGYQKFLKYSEAVFQAGYTDLVHVPFLNLWTMVKASPQLVRLEAYRSVYSKVAQYVQDPHLRQAFSFHSLLVGGNPFQTSSIYTLIHFLERNWGVFFPKGGTGALIQGLIRYFEDLGGKIELNQEIQEIQTESGKVKGVTLKDGTSFPCQILVSNADVVHTYSELLKREPKVARTTQALKKKDYSMSLFLIYFGTRKKYPHLAHHNVLFGPRYRELLNDIFKDKTLADDFSLYLHVPTHSDPDLAPEGCEGFYVLSPVPNLEKGDIDWSKEAKPYADRILQYLEKHYIPGLRSELVTQRVFTPEDFKTELNSHLGAAFSLAPTLTQSAYFRTHNRDRDIQGLYFVGAGTHPGAGVPGVVNSAKATASVIMNDLKEKRLEIDWESPQFAYV